MALTDRLRRILSPPAPLAGEPRPKRQQLLLLYLATSDLGSPVQAWSSYDGTGRTSAMSGDSDTPPYASVLAAMRDGWRVMQLPALARPLPGHEHETSFLRFEVVLERLVDV